MHLSYICLFAVSVYGALTATQTSTVISVKNDRLAIQLTKSNGRISSVTLDKQELLGSGSPGLYYDCQCIPSGFYTPGADNTTLVTGKDSSGKDYAGIIVSQTYQATGQFFQKYWFVRDGETSIHTWTRLAYINQATPFLRGLGELRSLYRPNSGIFTHFASDQNRWGPLPSAEAVGKQVVVQDATWNLGNVPNDPYVKNVSNWFTKYTLSVPWRNHKAHGMYADGSTTNGTSYGAWLVMNTVDTYFGGPTHSDLVVDGIVYDYIVSGHFGNGFPNITNGFDRTFGPVQYHFNSKGSLPDLLASAESLASPLLSANFYDDVAPHVYNYVPSTRRGSFSAKITLPSGASKPIAVLSQNGVDFQDNVFDTKAFQYWGEIDRDGSIEIPRVKEGTYRLTIYANGIFGDYIQDGVVVMAGQKTAISATWRADTAGRELWRIGVPDRSAGEFLHGDKPTKNPRAFPEYTIFWGAYDWKTDFPNGVNFTVGKSDVSKDLNYIHWSVFHRPTEPISTAVRETTNNWTVNFELSKEDRTGKTATFTVQLAGVKTASGNTEALNGEYSNLGLTYSFNGHPLSFVVPYYHSGSCGVRSAISCYQVRHKFTFDGTWLQDGWNKLVLSLPYNATNIETAVMPTSVYVQYDALRLELQ